MKNVNDPSWIDNNSEVPILPIKLDIEERGCRKLAAEKDGKCLSDNYKNNYSLLKWKCGKCGHVWEASYNQIQSGSWFPKHGRENRSKSLIRAWQKKRENNNAKCSENSIN